MRRISLLDCTLRDGGYINEWRFGKKAIQQIVSKLAKTGIEMIEIGFMKGDVYDPDCSIFPDIEAFKEVLLEKNDNILYLGMLDMSNPISLDKITDYDGESIDGIRVIFKQDKIDEAFNMCRFIKEKGYKLFVNFVNTDCYTDKEFIEAIEKYNEIAPAGMTIVDTFGTLNRKDFLRLVAIADNNMEDDIMLCYHAHNNLQQAFGNAEALVEMNLSRNIGIDACVFGMGRGAGNLNIELFADYMNQNYGTSYRITPMLEIMDEYLSDFYKTQFWGYSLPLYLSAVHGCHPNYAIYLAEKNKLTEKAFNELLRDISPKDKLIFNREKAENYYRKFMENYVDDSEAINRLSAMVQDKKVILLAPGKNLRIYHEKISDQIDDNTIIFSINFYSDTYKSSYVFTGNIRRFEKLIGEANANIIATSNIPDCYLAQYVVNFSSYTGNHNEIFDDSGLMALRLLISIGVKEVYIAGMDGYDETGKNYYEDGFASYYSESTTGKTQMVLNELVDMKKYLNMHFITPTLYRFYEEMEYKESE